MPTTATAFLVSILPAATGFLAGNPPGGATAFVVAAEPVATSWRIEGGGAVASAFLVSRTATATAFVVGPVADAALDYTVSARTCAALTVTYPRNTLTDETLRLSALDLEDRSSLTVSGGLSGDTWTWTVSTPANQVVELRLDGAATGPLSQPVLVNCRALKVAARLSKHSTCDCQDELLTRLLAYNALAVLLFQAQDYLSCAAYLHLLDDLAPCGCGCA